LFPALPDTATARDFWQVYRNGALHQATLNMPKRLVIPAASSLTHDVTLAVTVEPDGSFVLHPRLFSERVVRTIEADFAIFAGVGTAAPQLPTVSATVTPIGVTVLNTRGS
jgi:hypothetical protein